jgi:hypothetical protein
MALCVKAADGVCVTSSSPSLTDLPPPYIIFILLFLILHVVSMRTDLIYRTESSPPAVLRTTTKLHLSRFIFTRFRCAVRNTLSPRQLPRTPPPPPTHTHKHTHIQHTSTHRYIDRVGITGAHCCFNQPTKDFLFLCFSIHLKLCRASARSLVGRSRTPLFSFSCSLPLTKSVAHC